MEGSCASGTVPFASGFFGRPLFCACGTRRQLPVILEQVLEEAVVPFCGIVGPCAFEAAGDGVGTFAAAVLVRPAEALLFEGRALRFGTDVSSCRSGAMHLAEGVAADDQCDRLFIIHGHARKGLAYVFCGGYADRACRRDLRD